MDISSLLPLLLLQNTFSGSGSSGNGMADMLKIFGAMNGGGNPLFNAFGNLGNSGGMNFGNLFKNNPFSGAFGNNNAGSAGNSGGRNYRNDSGYGNTYNNTYRDNPSKDNLNAMFPEELLKMLRNLNRKK